MHGSKGRVSASSRNWSAPVVLGVLSVLSTLLVVLCTHCTPSDHAGKGQLRQTTAEGRGVVGTPTGVCRGTLLSHRPTSSLERTD